MPSWIVGIGTYGSDISRKRADRDGREVLSASSVHDPRIDDIARRAYSIFVISDTLMHADAVSLIGRLAAVDRSASGSEFDVGCPVGFLHARTRAAADEFNARQLSGPSQDQSRGTDVIVDSTLASVPSVPAPGLLILPYQEIKASDIRNAGGMRIFAVTAHGMSDHVYLDSDYICGRIPDPSRVPGGLNFLPSCMSEPYNCLFRPHGSKLPAYEIDAQHWFVNSCGSAQFEQGEFGADFSIWYSALEGHARSYVGTLRWKEGHGVEALLYRHLLNAGFPLGLAVAILNKVLQGLHLEQGPVYCLLGDPLDRVTTVPPGQVQQINSPGSSIDLRNGYARCIITDSVLVSAWMAGKLLLHASGPTAVYFSGVPTLGQRAVHIFAASHAGQDGKTTVRAYDHRSAAARVADIRKTFSTCPTPDLGIAGMYPNSVRQGGAENVRNRILNITRLARRSATDPLSIPNLRRNYQRLERDVSELDKATAIELLGKIKKSVYSISDHYRDTFELVSVNADRKCPHCAAQALRRVLRSMIDSSVERMELICPLCGIISDVPDERLPVTLSSMSAVVPGQEFKTSLTIANNDGLTARGYCVASITRASEYCAQAPDSPAQVEIPPGETRVVDFPFMFKSGTRPHLYTVKSALVVTGRIYMCRRPVGIAELNAA